MRTLITAVCCMTTVAAVFGNSNAESPAVTIYNQNFAVVRDIIPLSLEVGINQVVYSDTTAHVEPDSVILRDPAGERNLRIIEQNYRADPISQGLLLSLHEGETIDFLVRTDQKERIIKGRIVRSGYVPHQSAFQRYGQQYYQSQMAMAYGQQYYQSQMAMAYGQQGQPIIEVDGRLRFELPGTPLFPALKEDSILKPAFHWLLESDTAGAFNAELSYITGGMSWEANYNVVVPEAGDVLEIVGWVTLDNQSGKTFENARIKVVAGDVSKLREGGDASRRRAQLSAFGGGFGGGGFAPAVTEKSFDEYHLYTLERPTTLRDRETKQVEMVRAAGVESRRVYVYDGAKIDRERYRNWTAVSIRQEPGYGTESNPKVWVMREFVNSEENHLGMPLPRGRLRFYRRDRCFTGL